MTAANVSEFRWTGLKQRAAGLVADDVLTDVQIAAELGMSERQLERWKVHPSFQARVAELVEATRAAVMKRGIADKTARIKEYDRRWEALKRVQTARAADMPGVPGADDGLLVRQAKQIGIGRDAELVYEYPVDTGMLNEMRQIEKQAAQELGQWVDKVAPTTAEGNTLDLAGLILRVRASEEQASAS